MAGEEKQLVVEETTVVPGKMEFRLISPTESNFLKHIEWNKEAWDSYWEDGDGWCYGNYLEDKLIKAGIAFDSYYADSED